ncbi:hypothetical protein SDC9_175445 [bioreactor metagenome]|uniref:Uncharacterized protein n=1 Tax=bioreactor metagenome TaxID=1076179 RepID=A0A645GM43_9ZZZZ
MLGREVAVVRVVRTVHGRLTLRADLALSAHKVPISTNLKYPPWQPAGP